MFLLLLLFLLLCLVVLLLVKLVLSSKIGHDRAGREFEGFLECHASRIEFGSVL